MSDKIPFLIIHIKNGREDKLFSVLKKSKKYPANKQDIFLTHILQ